MMSLLPTPKLSRRLALALLSAALLVAVPSAQASTSQGQTKPKIITKKMIAQGQVVPFKVGLAGQNFQSVKVKIHGPTGVVAKIKLGATQAPHQMSWKLLPSLVPGKYFATWTAIDQIVVTGTTDTDVGTIKPECMPGGANYPC
jgi:methionine-rich copper-binding protein CopC